MKRALAAILALCAFSTLVWASDGTTVNAGATQDITAFSVCKRVTNGAGASLYVPTTSAGEWASFYNAPPTGVTAGLCVVSGTGYCWGYNTSGQLGINSTSQQNAPALVNGGYTDWVVLDAGGWFTCGVRANGTLWCWGEALNGKLGLGSTSPNRTTPQQVGTGTDWTMVSAGVEHACGIRGGVAYCWGDGPSGQIGNGGTTDQTSPALVSGGFSDWTKITAGEAVSCGIRGSGIAYCWGAAAEGKLGNGTTTPNQNTPQLVSGGFTDWVDIRAGRLTVCGVRANGRGYCWGDGSLGQIGSGGTADQNVPTEMKDGGFGNPYTDWVKIESYYNHTCGIRSAGGGTLYCWGTNGNGQLGQGNTTASIFPTIVTGGYTGWTDFSTGGYYSCGIYGGVSRCWGLNTNGWLGDNSTSQRTSPTLVQGGFTTWFAVNTAGSHTCGIKQ